MSSLIACLGGEKGTISHVAELIKKQDWEKVLIIGESRYKDIIKKENIEFIAINPNNILSELSKEIEVILKEKISDIEVGLNLVSGNGKLHMAVMAALIKLGIGIRLVALTPNGVEEI